MRQRGFTLLEVVVAVALLALLMFGLIATTAGSTQVTEVAQERRLALAKAETVLSRLIADPSLPQTWSDPNSGDPKPNQAYTTANPSGTPPPAAGDYVYDLKNDLGETFPPQLLLGQGTVTIDSFQANPIVQWTTARPFTWNTGRVYKVTVTVKWLPASQRRTNTPGTTPTAQVQLDAFYYRTPPQ